MGNCFLYLDDDVIAISNICEFFNFLGFLVKFIRRNFCRKLDNVFLDFEDEIFNYENVDLVDNLCDDYDDNNIVLFVVGFDFFIFCLVIDIINVFGDSLFFFGVVNIVVVK